MSVMAFTKLELLHETFFIVSCWVFMLKLLNDPTLFIRPQCLHSGLKKKECECGLVGIGILVSILNVVTGCIVLSETNSIFVLFVY